MAVSVGVGSGEPVRVFISYALESDEHVATVRGLWVFLRGQGIDARLDLPAAERRQDWPAWMLEQVRDARYVLVVASPAYKRRGDGLAAADEGRGVQFEARLIREFFYRDQDAGVERFLPVLLPGVTVESIPDFLSPVSGTHYRVDGMTVAGSEALLRVLTGQPYEVEPPLGQVPVLAPRAAAQAGAARTTGLQSELVLAVTMTSGMVSCRAELAGTVLGERTAPVPYGMDDVWDSPDLPNVEERLAEAGQRLRQALLDDETARHVTDLVDHAALGSVLEVVVEADQSAAWLPFELLRLPDGRVLATLPSVWMRRRIPAGGRAATAPLPGPLKILVAVAAPDEASTRSAPLDVEAEMQAVLDAIGGVEAAGSAEAKILEVAGTRQITEALRDDQYHVLHLSAHGSPQGVELADEDGKAIPVDNAALVGALQAAQKPLPLIVVSACAAAAADPAGEDALAAALIRHGADRVLGMQAPVTDPYATALAEALYAGLAAGRTPSGALADARRQLEERRQELRRSEPAAVAARRPEYAVPVLLCAADDPVLRDMAVTAEPLARPARPPAGGSVRTLRIGELIGRRAQLRTTLAALRGGSQARDRWGALSGVALTGIGGIGKTALAGRVLGRMNEDGWLTATHIGLWNPAALAKAVAASMAGRAGWGEQQAFLTDQAVADVAKVAMIGELLAQAQLLVLFDDFEQNLPVGGGSFTDPGFAEVFAGLLEAADAGRVLVTTRYPVPDGELLLQVPVPPLSPAELRRMFLRLSALRELPLGDRGLLMATIGGHPRLIEFVDALLRQGRANLKDTVTRLRKLAKEQGVQLSDERQLDQAIEEAMLLGSRDILLDQLMDLLTDQQREVLLQAAVTTPPMSATDLAVACHGDNPTTEQQTSTAAAVRQLTDLTLLTPVDPDEVAVHPWVSNALAAFQGDQADHRRSQAITMRLQRFNSGRGDYDDLVDIAHNLAATSRFDELSDFGLEVADLLAHQFGELSVAAFLGEIIPAMPSTRRYLSLFDRGLNALLRTGSITAGLQQAQAIVEICAREAEAHPDSAAVQRDLGRAYDNLARVLETAGQLAEAERRHRDSLAIRERLAAADPDNTQAQRDLSVSYNDLARVLVTAGQLEEAERLYREDLAIAERLAAADPDNTEAQRDLSISYNTLGGVLVTAGQRGEAERLYRDSLAIRERLAAADPDNTEAQRDLSVSYDNLARVLNTAGQLGEVERLYRDSLTIAERLAAADPGNTQAQRDLSISYINLARVLETAEQLEEVERLYRDSLTIAERVAAADPGNAEAQRDLLASYDSLARVLVTTGQLGEAERLQRDSLAIAKRLAAVGPGNTQAQRDLSISYNNLARVLENAEQLEEVEQLYRDSLAIAERLAAANPGNAEAQRDLGISYDNLARVLENAGQLEEAERLYRDSLAIAGRLAAADPGDVEAQRDLLASHDNVARVLETAGQLGEAERLQRDSMAIAERVAAADPGNTQAQRNLSVSYDNLARVLETAGQLGEAERLYRDSLAIAERLAAADPGNTQAERDLGISYDNLARVLENAGQLEAVERLYRDSLAIAERLAAADPGSAQAQGDLSYSYNNLAGVLVTAGQLAEAERLYRDSLAIAEQLFGTDHQFTTDIRQKLEELNRPTRHRD
jgi:tetratricopeptide (TPR) repeat protein